MIESKAEKVDNQMEGARQVAQAKSLAPSAKKVEASVSELSLSADETTRLANERTLFAAERTYAAWVRTALASLAAGIGATTLVRGVLPTWVGRLTGTILILFAGFCLFAGVWREVHGARYRQQTDLRALPVWLLIPMNLALLIVVCAALIGIWVA